MEDSKTLSPIEDIIEDARNGKMFILIDDEDRENEGDLVIPAQMATPDAINFMATHGRGLICLALTRERTKQLGLPMMPQTHGQRLATNFTVSIEAAEGVTTGISAPDRARTVTVAIDPVRRRRTSSRPAIFSAGRARRRCAGPRRTHGSRCRSGTPGGSEPVGRYL